MDQPLFENSNMGTSFNFSAIAIEPRISLIPTFSTNESRTLTEFASPSNCKSSKPHPKTFSDFPNPKISQKCIKNKSISMESFCDCPNIIVADDDHFQHLYYQKLLQRALKSEEKYIDIQNLSMHMCFSGEELIERMVKGSKCGCDMTRLVIVDYQMGKKKLNGVETSLVVRKDGYKGHLLLRTSETKDSLKENHKGFEQLLQKNVINFLVSKSDVTFGDKFIQRLVSEDMRTLSKR